MKEPSSPFRREHATRCPSHSELRTLNSMDLRLLFVAAIWGVNFSVIKFALTDFLPLVFTVARFSLAALFLFGLMRATGTSFAIARGDRPALIILGLIGVTLYNIFFMVGLSYTTASHSALLISLSPLVAAVLQTVSGRERLGARSFAGLALATVGVILIIRSHHGAITFSSSMVIGDLLTLCATIAWALYTIKARPLLEKYPAITVTAYSMAVGSIMLAPFAAKEITQVPWSQISPGSWSAFLFAALIAGGIAHSLWYQGVKRIGVTRTIVYHYLMPFFAVLVAALFLEERITLAQIIGGLSVLFGVAIVQKRPNR